MKLGDIVENITSGGTPSTKNDKYYDGDIPWLRTQEVNFNFIENTEIKITSEGLKNSSAKWIAKDSVIVAMYGNSAGRVAYNKIPLTTNQACCNITVDDSKADSLYLYYYLTKNYSNLEKLANGGAQQNLNVGIIKNFPFPNTPLPEQHRIADILSSFDNKIELLRKENNTLEDIAQSIFKEWFVKYNFPNKDGKPYRDNNGKMIDSELGLIPEGWRVGKLGEMKLQVTDYVANGSFASLKENVTLYAVPEYALFIRNTDLKTNFKQKVYADKRSYDFLKKTQLHGGEIIISNVGDVGSVHLCPYFKNPMVLGNNTICIKSEYQSYLYLLFISKLGKSLISSITGGSAQPKFNKTDFRNLFLIIPQQEILQNFDLLGSSILKKILINNTLIESTKVQKRTLLYNLIR